MQEGRGGQTRVAARYSCGYGRWGGATLKRAKNTNCERCSDLAGARRAFVDGFSLADQLAYAPVFRRCALMLAFWHATHLRTFLGAVVARMAFRGQRNRETMGVALPGAFKGRVMDP